MNGERLVGTEEMRVNEGGDMVPPLSGYGKTTAWRKVGVFGDNFLRYMGLIAGSFIAG